MIYNFIKFLHIILAGLLVGGHFYHVFFKLNDRILKLKSFIIFSLILQLLTGLYLFHEAGFYFYDLWIIFSFIILLINIVSGLLVLFNKIHTPKQINHYNILMLVLLTIAICLMVFKPELD